MRLLRTRNWWHPAKLAEPEKKSVIPMKTVATFSASFSGCAESAPACSPSDRHTAPVSPDAVSTRGIGSWNHPADDLVLYTQALANRPHAPVRPLPCRVQHLIQQVYRTMQLALHCIHIAFSAPLQYHSRILTLTMRAGNMSDIDASPHSLKMD